ncbi:MAG TPA: MASE1 domain-containing protein [Planctomycetota bacterium]|nr:MASE1 domain-containing protein [Planctomycetota bacterium]
MLRYVGQVLAITAIYFLSGRLGLSLAFELPQVTTVWPPSGFALAALLLFGTRCWPGVFAGALLINIALNVPWPAALGIASGNTLEAVAGSLLLKRAGFKNELERRQDVIALIFIAGMISTTLSATIGTASLYYANLISPSQIAAAWWRCWVGYTASIWGITPLILTWFSRTRTGAPRRLETAAVFLILLGVCYITMLSGLATRLKFLVFPVLAWSALRLGQRNTATACALVTGFAIAGAQRGTFGWTNASVEELLGGLMLFSGVVTFTALMIGALTAEGEKVNAMLRRRDAQFQMALEAGRMGTWNWDIASGEIAWSENLAAIHGMDPGAAPQTFGQYLETIHSEDRELVKSAIEQAIKAQTFRVEYRPAGDSAGTWFAARGRVLYDKEGNPVMMAGLCADISDRKRAEQQARLNSEELERTVVARTLELRETVSRLRTEIEARKQTELALRQSEERLRLITEQVPAILFTLDRDLKILSATGAGLKSINLDPQIIIGRSLLEFLESQDPHHPPIQAARRAIDGHDETYEMEWRGRTYQNYFRPLRDIDGTVFGALGMSIDITELRRIKAALEDEARHKDEFLAILAHELRNPLAPIRNAGVLLQSAQSEESIRHIGKILERQVNHIVRLVDDLLDIARLSHGKILLQKQCLDLLELLRNVIEEHRGKIAASKLNIEARLPSEPLWVDADPVRLTQIFDNLLHNATKFTPPGGSIFVEAQQARDENAAIVSIRDTGIGMEPQMIQHLFQPFAQADRSLDRSVGGLGLGLALVQSLVNLHGGSIRATSPGMGQGSEFTLRLPLMSEEPHAAAQPAPVAAQENRLSILLVEDNVDAADSLRMLLESFGHHVVVVHDGHSGLEHARGLRPDAIICDIGLPHGMNGYDFARAFTQDASYKPAFLIAMSGYGQAQDKQRARDAGFHTHVTKPADIAELKRVLSVEVEAWRAARAKV